MEAGSRKRNQPAPPAEILEALTKPYRDPTRPWLLLLEDEQPPRLVEVDKPEIVIWSSLWTQRPDARIRFDLATGARRTAKSPSTIRRNRCRIRHRVRSARRCLPTSTLSVSTSSGSWRVWTRRPYGGRYCPRD